MWARTHLQIMGKFIGIISVCLMTSAMCIFLHIVHSNKKNVGSWTTYNNIGSGVTLPHSLWRRLAGVVAKPYHRYYWRRHSSCMCFTYKRNAAQCCSVFVLFEPLCARLASKVCKKCSRDPGKMFHKMWTSKNRNWCWFRICRKISKKGYTNKNRGPRTCVHNI